ncbi:MAG: chemotaxis protein CheD [Lachnospiraceae bacterium]|nr:chemotaxis protein CheD [Lachnospiraceae bacterium]
MSNMIKVGIADMKICQAPDKITTIGLGSCVGVAMYDGVTGICGLLHIMLPDSTKIANNSNKLKFADTGIDALLESVLAAGAKESLLKTKIAGGAQMFNYLLKSSVGNIGENNVTAVKNKLAELKIPILAEDVGKNFGRTVIFDPETYELAIVKAGSERYVI